MPEKVVHIQNLWYKHLSHLFWEPELHLKTVLASEALAENSMKSGLEKFAGREVDRFRSIKRWRKNK
ncbi:MAG: hypothetical protein ABL952_14610 [Pyrinomonadaceae bacterium]